MDTPKMSQKNTKHIILGQWFLNCCTKISLTARNSRTQIPSTFLIFSFIEREELQSFERKREREINLKSMPKITNVN